MEYRLGKIAVGIDIGTTTVSGIVLDGENGTIPETVNLAGEASLPSANEWEKMQDPEKLIGKVQEILDGFLRRYPGISSVGITGQMHGILYTDEEGRAVSPLYTWQDGRAMHGSPCACDRMEEICGYRVPAGYGLATHYANVLNGDVPENAAKLCTVMDYAVMRLTGRKTPLIHSSDAASLGLYRMAENRFDTDAVTRCGMDVSLLPEVTAGWDIAGYYRGIPVTVGIGDNQASFMGAVKEPDCSVLANFGTGSQISLLCGNTTAEITDGAMELRPYPGSIGLISGSALCGGRAYAMAERFFRSYVAACGIDSGEQYEIMNRLAEKAMDEGRVMKVHTCFCGTRAEPEKRGWMEEIGEENFTPGSMIAGVLWGMTEELHSLFLKMPHDKTDTLIVSGNAARKNPALRRMLGEVFGMKVLIPCHREEAAFGAAVFGAAGAGEGDLGKHIVYTEE